MKDQPNIPQQAPFDDAAALKAAIRRGLADEPQAASADVMARLRQRLSAEARQGVGAGGAAGGQPIAPPVPLRGRRLWIPSAVAAALLLAVTLVVILVSRGQAPTYAVLTDAVAADAYDVHCVCSSPEHAKMHRAAYVDVGQPMVEQARQVAGHVHVSDPLIRERLGRYRLASCADCPIEGTRTVHLLYAAEGEGDWTQREVISLFAMPAGAGQPALARAGEAIEQRRYEQMNLAGFSHGGTRYLLVGRAGPAELSALARELRGGLEETSLPPAVLSGI